MERALPIDRLNPASMPFFPGALRTEEEQESPFGSFSWTSREGSSNSAISPTSTNNSGFRPSPNLGKSIASRSESDSSRPSLFQETDTGLMAAIDNFVDGEETPIFPIFRSSDNTKINTMSLSANSFDMLANGVRRDDLAPLNQSLAASPAPFVTSMGRTQEPSPPPSSIGSDSAAASQLPDLSSSFDAQIRSSPVIKDLFERLLQCEASTREVQRELGIVHQKVNILVERSMVAKSSSEPEFKNPFALSPNSTIPNQFPPSANRFSVANTTGPTDPKLGGDDLSQVTARLNTLTSSVSQLLALQTQQHFQTTNSTFSSNPGIGLNPPLEVAPKQLGMPNIGGGPTLGHGFPQRPDLRGGARNLNNPPMRTWSTGNLDLPLRNGDSAISSRQEAVFRGGKRGSVGPMARRESTSVIDTPGEVWSGPGRESANSSSFKWDNLPLAPELLRSIAKFGVGPPNKVQQRALPFLLRGSDIIAQAPPTQERIAAYAIPAIHLALNISNGRSLRGPVVLMVSTTVDQATQAQRMIRDLGGPIGIRSALGVGSNGANNGILQEVRFLQQNIPHVLCGTPQKLHALFTAPGGLSGADVRFLVLDEVDQLIARNLHDFVYDIVKLLPPSRSRPKDNGSSTPPSLSQSPIGNSEMHGTSSNSVFATTGRRFSSALASPNLSDGYVQGHEIIERQTALFSNTVPQDVLNLANTIQLREPVRVLVRRDGNVTHSESGQGTRGLRQFYLYLAFTGGSRKDVAPSTPGGGLGTIGSGRAASNNPETAQAREWKLDALADLFEDLDVAQAIVHVGGMTALDSVVYKLVNRGLEAVPLHSDMNASSKMAALNKFRAPSQMAMRPSPTKILVVYDVQVKAPDVFQIPLVINYDLPKAVEEYAHRVAPAISSTYARVGVVVNFVTATGGDVEMLRSIECFYKIKCPEVPMSLRELLI